MNAPHDPVLRVVDVKLHFPVQARLFRGKDAAMVRAVDGISFEVPRGSCFAVVGESGSGKSSLARLLVGLVAPTSGEVWLDGAPLSKRTRGELRRMRRRVQMVLQDPHASLDPRMTVEQILKEALVVHALGDGASDRSARIARVLNRVGLGASFAGRFPHELSGGQRQRVAIARAIICEPDVLILDEPVSALDVSVQAQVVNLLMSLQRELGLTYLIITHDLSLVGHMADAVGVMYLGRFVEQGEAAQVCRTPQHPYTRSLFASVYGSVGGQPCDGPLEGTVPSPLALPGGCTFHTRCPAARRLAQRGGDVVTPDGDGPAVPAICAHHTPELRRVATEHTVVTCHFAGAESIEHV
ncbi:oligopeptide/dipeptide ABC transporter ATP-binding protein [Caballeronia sp. LZ035]|uniref:ABC transporter ATP-binding protein n=1 Tax=Caballeronia sp. LZ035 TaxID=3038568 RepID=UPI0028626964|nr:oligopeptide/dipeptide ABC transporter ATP-binding protein [Caballeronia sp. LZ035]MDR5758794.1 ATP-binding cassette domain-containing protein [Caballeronia sp. LZ035]